MRIRPVLHRSGCRLVTALVTVALAFAAGCGVTVEPLMPTPILFTEVGVDPLAHVEPSDRWTPNAVYFATTRERTRDAQRIDYGNAPAERMSLGFALVGFGDGTISWADLAEQSSRSEREEEVSLSIAGMIEVGSVARVATTIDEAAPETTGWLLEEMGRAIQDAGSNDVLIYVHGAKVNFYNACAFAAQLGHFMGRDITPFAFSWPTRQDIFSYAFGRDVARGYDASEGLATLIELLARETPARRIHVLSWSAGARVASSAVEVLRDRHPEESVESLRERLRLGTLYFAAGDVPRSEFIQRLPVLDDLSERVTVTTASEDEALFMSKVVMGGDVRLGADGGALSEAEAEIVDSLSHLEVVAMSYGRDRRGFDITGHQYWFNHPWASTDVILAIRGDLDPEHRGLVRAEEYRPFVWSMPEDYPTRVHEAIRTESPWAERMRTDDR